MSEVQFAGFGRRLAAAVLDSLVWIIAIGWFLGSFPGDFFNDHPAAAGAIVIVLFSLWFNYFAFCEWRFGQTIGKNALGIRVVPVDAGARLTYNAAAIRNLLRLVDLPLTLIGVDYLIVRSSPRRQRLGDRAARTVVLREPPPQEQRPDREEAARGPTAAELFGDASEALGRVSQPVAPPGAPQGDESPGTGLEEQRGDSEANEVRSGGFPPATWGARRALGGTAIGLLIAVILVPLAALPIDPDLSAFGGDGRVSVSLDGKARGLVGIGSEGSGAVVGARMADRRLGLVGLSDAGGPDTDLGADGLKLGERALGFTPRALAVDSDERILVAGEGRSGRLVLERYESDGDLDGSFGHGGRVRLTPPPGFRVEGIAALEGDSVLLAGAGRTQPSIAVARVAPDGDASWSQISAAGAPRARDVLTVAGGSDGSIAAVRKAPLEVSRYLPDGRLDPGFGSGGTAPLALPPGTTISSAAVRPGSDGGGVLVAGVSGQGQRATVIEELSSAGNPEDGFGSDGVVSSRFFSLASPPAVAPADHDKVFVAQLDPEGAGGSSEVSVARLEKDGDLDGGVVAILLAQGLLVLTLVATAANVALSGPGTVAGSPLRVAAGRLGIRRPRPKWGRWTALALLAYYAIAVAYALLVVQPEQEDIARSLGLGSGVLTTFLAVFLIALAAPVSEELFFRGMLFGGLRRNMGRMPAAAISALVFGALHATTGVTAVPPLIVFGFVLALLYERTGSLLPGMLGHAINNALALALAT